MFRRRMMRRAMGPARPVLMMLQNPDPAVRLQAVNILGNRRKPRAAWLLQRVYQNDPDPRVKEQAKQYLTQWAQALLNQFNAAPQAMSPSEKMWKCEFCGTKDVKGAACPNCGAPRPDEDDE